MDDFLERWRVLIVLLLLAVIVAGVAYLAVRWPRSSPPISTASAPSRQGAAIVIATRTTEPRQLKVYITGAVARPGVYTLQEGSRVEDAVKAAGGATTDADLSAINLAQRLRDEGYINVPRLSGAPSAGGTPAPAAPATSGKININAASLGELDTLPGIGSVYAQRIIDYRTKNGPFQATQDLVDKKILTQSVFDKIKDLIDVR